MKRTRKGKNGPPLKYLTEEARIEGQRALRRASRARWRVRDRGAERAAFDGHGSRIEFHEQAPDPRPPVELLMERDHRIAVMSTMAIGRSLCGDPPPGYWPEYYVTAWRNQRAFACQTG